MRYVVLFFLSIVFISCLGDDDGILDGDLITAITGDDRIYSSSGSYVNMETTIEESGYGTAEIYAGFYRDDLRISLSIRSPETISEFSSTTNFTSGNEAIINYTLYRDGPASNFVVDASAPFFFSLNTFTKNEIIGNFEFTLVNEDDPLDKITFKEGYLYVYD